MKLLIDFESRSRADLPSVGQHMYARHDSTEVMCLGWKIIDEKKAHVLTMPEVYTNTNTSEFRYAVKHAELVVAHNAAFEQAMWKHCLLPTTGLGSALPYLPPEKWLCTLSLCSILSLPRGLEQAGLALNLDVKKDVEGRKLLLQMCKPRPVIQNIKAWIEWKEENEFMNRLYDYCKTDLWTEEALFNRLKVYKPFTKTERELWVLDQKINQRGFKVDVDLVNLCLRLINQEETELTKQLQLKTFGWVKTSKQVKNLRDFLKDQGFDIPNLQKKTVDDTLQQIEKIGHVKNQNVIDVLKIRQSLGKSSTSKYEAFKFRADEDGRVRDNLLYHGASTGRWAGAGVQPQNFPRGTVKITEEVLDELKSGDLELIRMLHGRPMDVLSSALRSMITASEGHELFCADFSSIEARVLLWVAGDKEGLKEYEAGADTYIAMASTIFGQKYETIKAKYDAEGFSDERQLGKKVILACFEEDTKVLTKRGWVNIIDVLPTDLLWDGVEWCLHEGVVCQGQKETINLFGVGVTPDHKILTPKGWVPAFQVQKENTESLQSVTNLANLQCAKLSKGNGAGLSQLKFHVNAAHAEGIVRTRQIFSMAKAHAAMFVQNKLQQIQINCISTMRRLFPMMNTVGVYSIGSAQFFQDAIENQVEFSSTTGEGVSKYTLHGQKTKKNFFGILSGLKAGTNQNLNLIGLMSTKGMNLTICGLFQKRQTCQTEEKFQTCKKKSMNLKNVYDIVNVGTRNRFTILTSKGAMVVHNCGYQMGVKKFIQSCKDDGLEVPESMAMQAHAAFRKKYPTVPQVWSNYEKAAIYAVLNKKRVTVNKVVWYVDREFLFAELPSGRRLAYYKPEIRNEETPFGDVRPKLYVWTVDSKTKQWVQRAVYGGLLTENIVQAISRDCMAEAMVRCEDSGYKCLVTVHDENLTERPVGEGSLEDFKKLMSERPQWGKDIPLKVGAWSGHRYRK